MVIHWNEKYGLQVVAAAAASISFTGYVLRWIFIYSEETL